MVFYHIRYLLKRGCQILSFLRLLLTFFEFFCRIKWYKGKWWRFCRRMVLSGCCLCLFLCGGCGRTPAPVPTPTPQAGTDAEMRGVWLSYIELDAMLKSGDPTSAKDAIDTVMATCAAEELNTVFFHVRAHGDAYYPSEIWPTATHAAAVIRNGLDPLAYAIEAAEEQGISLHAWVNPYRLGARPIDTADCFEKGGVWYLNPADDAARRQVLDGVREILDNYAVDGIHFDDYFYPAGMAAKGEPFEDIPRGTDVTRWRQTQVDTLVSGVYSLCHQRGKVFGVSPMADLQRCRTEAYADVSRWMTEAGYIDYVCPQLYTGFKHQTRPFTKLLAEWSALPRRQDVRLYVGLALYKVGMENDPYAGSGATEWRTDADIIPRQIQALTGVADGYVLFRYGNLESQHG